jgi:hypothetical protein
VNYTVQALLRHRRQTCCSWAPCRSQLKQEASHHYLNSQPALWQEKEITGKLASSLGTVDKAFAAVRTRAAAVPPPCTPWSGLGGQGQLHFNLPVSTLALHAISQHPNGREQC